MKAYLMQFLQACQRTGEHSLAAPGVMPGGVRIIQANAKTQRACQISQWLQLLDTPDQRLGRIGQHQAGPVLQRVIENTYEVLIDERLASSEGKLFHPKSECFIDKRNGISK